MDSTGGANVLGARLVNLLQLLEKLYQRVVKRNIADDVQQLRYTAGKLLHVLCSQERSQKDLILKDGYHVEILCRILESRNDKHVTENCLLIIQELLGRTQIGRRCTALINGGVPSVLLRLMADEGKEKDNQHLLLVIHQILIKLGPKDRKFCVKARLNGALPVTVSMIKTNITNSKLLLCLLSVLKLYSPNSVNAAFLGKHGVILYLFKAIEVCGKRSPKPLKIILDTLANLTKLKTNCSRVINLGGVQLLLPMYYEWQQNDTRNRQIDLRKAILIVLKNVTNIDLGRKAFVDNNGIRILYESAQETVDCKEVESMIILASVIMRKCCPQDTLPLDKMDSPVWFKLPHSDFHKVQGVSQAYELMALNTAESDYLPSISSCFTSTPRTESDATYTVEEDDALYGKDEHTANDASGVTLSDDDDEDEDKDCTTDVPYTRPLNQLRVYEAFFPEMFLSTSPQHNQSGDDINTSATTTLSSDILSDPSTTSSNYMRPTRSSLNKSDKSSQRCDSRIDVVSQSSKLSGAVTAVQTDPQHMFLTAIPQKMFEFPPTEFKPPISDYFFSAAAHARFLTSGSLGGAQKSDAFSVTVEPARIASAKKTKTKSRVLIRRSRRLRTDCGLTTDFQDSLTISTACGAPHDSQDSSDGHEVDGATLETATVCLHDPETHTRKSLATKSVLTCTKLAFPDYNGVSFVSSPQPLYHRKLGVQRAKIFEDIQRMIEPNQIYNRAVYDLDQLISRTVKKAAISYSLLNDDAERVRNHDMNVNSLTFNSQFECGNLRKAIQVRDVEYDLVINPDVNTDHHHQWFYFEVSNMISGVNYRFNIVNSEKMNSQFNFGMQPVMYSVTEALQGRPYWTRTGMDICYYKNHFTRQCAAANGNKGYYTTTFTISFPHSRDVCYLAYHYPYTYTTLITQISNWEKQVDRRRVFFRHQTLCATISGNAVPVLTITSQPDQNDEKTLAEFKARPYIFLSARVHPGESNSSWVMKGTIDFLLSDQPAAQTARDMYIFKVVPMLNPDGVINGNHRCSLTGEDLNRRWLYPCPNLHPTIYHTKGLLMYMNHNNITPFVYCDYHGHSRRKNVFLYGCAASQSWCVEDKTNLVFGSTKQDEAVCKALPKLLQQTAPAFSLANCTFTVEKGKESTARVVVWREMGVARSYTMESSYCGCDQGVYKDTHITIHELTEMGHKFIEALTKLEYHKVETAEMTRDVIYMPCEGVAEPTMPETVKPKISDVPTSINLDKFLKDDVSDYDEGTLDKEDAYYDYEFDEEEENSEEETSDEVGCVRLTGCDKTTLSSAGDNFHSD